MTKTLLILTLLAIILFIDYLLIIAIGCSAYSIGAGEQFYCGFFCKFGITLFSISVLGGLWFGLKKLPKIAGL